jgi:hypothetical protein
MRLLFPLVFPTCSAWTGERARGRRRRGSRVFEIEHANTSQHSPRQEFKVQMKVVWVCNGRTRQTVKKQAAITATALEGRTRTGGLKVGHAA